MTRKEALLFLDANEENWQDNLSLKLFELKKDLLRRVLIPKLLLKKAEKVTVWYEASQVLLGEQINKVLTPSIELPGIKGTSISSMIELYRFFEISLMEFQLKLTQSTDAKTIAETIYSIAKLEITRQQLLLPIARTLFFEEDSANFEVKLSEDTQTGVIISELKQFDKEQINEKKDLLLLPNFSKDLQRILRSN